jgi:hypothetical protein
LPLFQDTWPSATVRRRQSLVVATDLAEKSAAEAAAPEGLHDAIIEAVMTAGAALFPVYGLPCEEPVPPNAGACEIAAFAAKTAEWAAKAAGETPAKSAEAALEAFGFTRQVAEAASDQTLVAGLA